MRRIEENPGFGAAANEVLEVVEGAAFYLLCHDDVALAPDVVRTLVTEAFRANASVLGPKLTAWDDTRRILQLGQAMDRTGRTVDLVEREKLDQGQHDEAGDVFVVTGGCTLVRADLFAEIGGFDEAIDLLGDDVSLCWRAHLAGARVAVAPFAEVRHKEALSSRLEGAERDRRLVRHRLRTAWTCQRGWSMVVGAPRAAVVELVELVASLATGRAGHARAMVAGAWWNLRAWRQLRAARRQVSAFRHVPDRSVRARQVTGTAWVRDALRGGAPARPVGRFGAGEPGPDPAGRRRAAGREATATVVTAVAVAAVVLLGSRHMLTQGVPVIGEMVPVEGPARLLRTWSGGWNPAGLGSSAPAPAGLALLGVGGLVTFGQVGLLRLVLTVGLVPLGAWGAYRLAAPFRSRWAQLATVAVYVTNPLPYNALATGSWSALAVYAAAPALVARLARAASLAPFVDPGSDTGPSSPDSGSGRAWRSEPVRCVLVAGVITALGAAISPALVALPVVLGVALALGSVLTGSVRGSGRVLAAALGASAVAAVLHLPTAVDMVRAGSIEALLGPPRGATGLGPGALLRFEVGPWGAGVLGYAPVAAASLALLVGRSWRHRWAVRAWSVALVGWGLAWSADQGWMSVGSPDVAALVAPAALGMALAVGLGVAVFEVDLPGYRFGWSQLVSAVTGLAAVLALVPIAAGSVDGSWSTPRGDATRVLRAVDADLVESPGRVLWLGDPGETPVAGWSLRPGLVYGLSTRGTPGTVQRWAGPDDDATVRVASALGLALDGQTARLGRVLAPMAVRYVVVVQRLAPAPWADGGRGVAAEVTDALGGQLDLRRLDVPAGLLVYENQAALPARALVGDSVGAGRGTPEEVLGLDLAGATPVLPAEDGPTSWSGELPAGRVAFSEGASSRWQLEVEGRSAPRSRSFGWANAFEVAEPGSATLSYRTPPLRWLASAGQAALWMVVVTLAVVSGPRRRAGRRAP